MKRDLMDLRLQWQLLYTKPHAEEWAGVNLARQGYAVILPRLACDRGVKPLFPRYLFVGFDDTQSPDPLRNTYGVSYVVHCGPAPARVPREVITELLSRMDARGLVQVDGMQRIALLSHRERERVRALLKLANAGYRVRSA